MDYGQSFDGVRPDAVRVPAEAIQRAFSELDADVRAALASLGRPVADALDLEQPVVVLTPGQAKGLEFDVVVLVEPAEVLDASGGDLYVAMTRPTRALHVLHGRPLPPGFDETS